MSGRVPRRSPVSCCRYGVFLVVVGVTATVQTAWCRCTSRAAINTAVAATRHRAGVRERRARGGDLTVPPTGSRGAARRAAGGARRERRHAAAGDSRPIRHGRLTSAAGRRSTPRSRSRTRTFAAAAGSGQGGISTPARRRQPGVRALFPLLDEAGETGRSSACGATPRRSSPRSPTSSATCWSSRSRGLVAGAILYLAFRPRRAGSANRPNSCSTRPSEIRSPGCSTTARSSSSSGPRSSTPARRTPIGIALVDVDNFRLLNETHGHDAGDDVLQRVVATLRSQLDGTTVLGRYGPDEFLVIAPAAAIAALEPGLEHVRDALVDESLQLDASERLPMTISAGIATYPERRRFGDRAAVGRGAGPGRSEGRWRRCDPRLRTGHRRGRGRA